MWSEEPRHKFAGLTGQRVHTAYNDCVLDIVTSNPAFWLDKRHSVGADTEGGGRGCWCPTAGRDDCKWQLDVDRSDQKVEPPVRPQGVSLRVDGKCCVSVAVPDLISNGRYVPFSELFLLAQANKKQIITSFCLFLLLARPKQSLQNSCMKATPRSRLRFCTERHHGCDDLDLRPWNHCPSPVISA